MCLLNVALSMKSKNCYFKSCSNPFKVSRCLLVIDEVVWQSQTILEVLTPLKVLRKLNNVQGRFLSVYSCTKKKISSGDVSCISVSILLIGGL